MVLPISIFVTSPYPSPSYLPRKSTDSNALGEELHINSNFPYQNLISSPSYVESEVVLVFNAVYSGFLLVPRLTKDLELSPYFLPISMHSPTMKFDY